MAFTTIVGLGAGTVAAVAAAFFGRAWSLVAAYAATACAASWAAGAIAVGNRADEMGGIPLLVVGGALFWIVVAPGIVYIVMAERRR